MLSKKIGTILLLVYVSLIGIGITYSDNLIFLAPEPAYTVTEDFAIINSKSIAEGRYRKPSIGTLSVQSTG